MATYRQHLFSYSLHFISYPSLNSNTICITPIENINSNYTINTDLRNCINRFLLIIALAIFVAE
jgi:hypothetical protein